MSGIPKVTMFMTSTLIQSCYISYSGSEIHITSRFAAGPWWCCCKFNNILEMWSEWYYQKTCMVKTTFPCLLLLGFVMRAVRLSAVTSKYAIPVYCFLFLKLKVSFEYVVRHLVDTLLLFFVACIKLVPCHNIWCIFFFINTDIFIWPCL